MSLAAYLRHGQGFSAASRGALSRFVRSCSVLLSEQIVRRIAQGVALSAVDDGALTSYGKGRCFPVRFDSRKRTLQAQPFDVSLAWQHVRLGSKNAYRLQNCVHKGAVFRQGLPLSLPFVKGLQIVVKCAGKLCSFALGASMRKTKTTA